MLRSGGHIEGEIVSRSRDSGLSLLRISGSDWGGTLSIMNKQALGQDPGHTNKKFAPAVEVIQYLFKLRLGSGAVGTGGWLVPNGIHFQTLDLSEG